MKSRNANNIVRDPSLHNTSGVNEENSGVVLIDSSNISTTVFFFPNMVPKTYLSGIAVRPMNLFVLCLLESCLLKLTVSFVITPVGNSY